MPSHITVQVEDRLDMLCEELRDRFDSWAICESLGISPSMDFCNTMIREVFKELAKRTPNGCAVK